MANKCKHCGKGNILQSTLFGYCARDSNVNPKVGFDEIGSQQSYTVECVEKIRSINRKITDKCYNYEGPSIVKFLQGKPYTTLQEFLDEDWYYKERDHKWERASREIQMDICADCGEVNRMFVEPFTEIVEIQNSFTKKLAKMEKIATKLPALLEEYIQSIEEEKRQNEIVKLEKKLSKLKDK